MNPDDRIRIRHIADALHSAIRFSAGRQREDLDRDEMLVFALARAVEIVGEAASRVSSETRESHPQVPWALIVGMRNRLIHAYFDVNHDILWATATRAVPELLAQIEPILDQGG